MDVLVSWVILSLAVWITALVLPGFHLKSHTSLGTAGQWLLMRAMSRLAGATHERRPGSRRRSCRSD